MAADGAERSEQQPRVPAEGDHSVSSLRGAQIDIDPRRAGRIAATVGCALLGVITVIAFAVTAKSSDQISRLKSHGVEVTIVVTTCQGNLGGSGSNGAGYSCTGSYRLDGAEHSAHIAGTSSFYTPGHQLAGIVDPGDPASLSTAASVRATSSSWTDYLVPGILLIVFLTLVATLIVRRRRER